MKSCLICFTCFVVMFFSSNAQANKKFCIQTEKGVMSVLKTSDGKDMITMSIACWDELAAGTKYTSYYLSWSRRKLCIEIADKKRGLCKKGIGFGCSMFDCPYVPDLLPNKVNDENRICAVNIKKQKGFVQIIFIDHVDWESLQNSITDQPY